MPRDPSIADSKKDSFTALGLHLHPDGHNAPAGISLGLGSEGTVHKVYTCRHISVRKNVIRHADPINDPVSGSDVAPIGISFVGCESILLDGNIVDLNSTKLIQYSDCKTVQCFANMTPSGVVIEGTNWVTNGKNDQITTAIEDAVAMALL